LPVNPSPVEISQATVPWTLDKAGAAVPLPPSPALPPHTPAIAHHAPPAAPAPPSDSQVSLALAALPWGSDKPANATAHPASPPAAPPVVASLPWMLDSNGTVRPVPTGSALPATHPSTPAASPAVAALPWELDTNGTVRPVQAASASPTTKPSLAPPKPFVASAVAPANISTASLPWQTFVMAMCRDAQGYIWVATEDQGACRCAPSAPLEQQYQWFTTHDGLGDDNAYAIACDKLGRIWVGHLNHGVSVYNGQKWQCYELLGGISRPDTLTGPLGERVFAIAVCPTDGDVWMATNCGLARYSQNQDTWSYYTRVEGLPSDQAQTLAFDADGNLYVGTQCDGIAMASAADNYKTWRVVTGPDKAPTTPIGDGLPTNFINAMLVAKDGAVYAATTTGLAYSQDHGKTWKYVRGQDYADKVRGLYKGPPEEWHEESGAILAEDYVTCLAEGENGSLWIGFRSKG
jgi:hypothetical protein